MISPVSLCFYNKRTAVNNHSSQQYLYNPVYYRKKQDTVEISFKGSSIVDNLTFKFKNKIFEKDAMTPGNPNWAKAVQRYSSIETKENEIRSDFERDRNRIMHTEGFDRMRFKAQVFPVCENDMVSTRSSHVLQVSDIARNISKKLGLNEELAETIAMGHDIGHSPFGHDGEKSLKNITIKEGLPLFWHEKNSLRMVDKILTLENSKGKLNNLGLTYAVRDGIINHCGEVDDNFIKPRKNILNLEEISSPGKVQPYTWEGIIVKVSDKIAYLGKDIEDATKMGIFTKKNHQELNQILKKYLPDTDCQLNNTYLINLFVNDLIKNSSPQKGIGFSKPVYELMKEIKNYNYEHIYHAKGVKALSQKQCDEIIEGIFYTYKSMYKGKDTITYLETFNNPYISNFKNWLVKYSQTSERPPEFCNKILYDISKPEDYKQAIVDYISGMTDKYAIKTFQVLTKRNVMP